MKLSELATGSCGVIVKVTGHGSFRKRIIEMGFIKGKTVEVLHNAPLQDPVEYRVMGYEVSLRHSEAQMIEVVQAYPQPLPEGKGVSLKELPKEDINDNANIVPSSGLTPFPLGEGRGKAADIPVKRVERPWQQKRRIINVALVGNPNCGKTSLFNFASGAHEHVGNYSGVTVDAKEGYAEFEGYRFNIVDLPGTYSLSAYSPEERYVRQQLTDNTPDFVINVIDTSNLERNLYLTTQLIDMNLRMICALNMFDEAERRGDDIDISRLEQLFGVPMVPTIFKSGRGVKLLFHIIINMYEGLDYVDNLGKLPDEVAEDIRQWHEQYSDKTLEYQHEEDFASGNTPRQNVFRHIHINHGHEIENGIKQIQKHLKRHPDLTVHYSTRYLAIKLLENDSEALQAIASLPDAPAIEKVRKTTETRVKEETGDDLETAIMDAKYGFINGALQEAGYKAGDNHDAYRTTNIIDSILTNRYLGIPLFIAVIWVMFQTTFSLGQYPMQWIDNLVQMLAQLADTHMPEGPLKDMIVDGVIGGVGAVIVFLPQILILYAFISFMEDSGYMARAAFIMDKLMHRIGLHGKSFIPLIMAFGCNVPAVMSTRTIESRKSRYITMLIIPFMSCSARLPVYIMIVGTFFATSSQPLIMISLYLIGIIVAALSSRLFSHTLFAGDDTPFVMELPPYRIPTSKAIARHTWEKAKEYLRKMGGIILVASIIVWALGYFPNHNADDPQTRLSQSYIAKIGETVTPVFQPQHFNWKLDVAIITGIGAKEIVASTLGVLYSADAPDTQEASDSLLSQMQAEGITSLTAYSFLIFVLLYLPCIATIAAIKNETGSWRWALFAAAYTTIVAWLASAAFQQIGLLLT